MTTTDPRTSRPTWPPAEVTPKPSVAFHTEDNESIVFYDPFVSTVGTRPSHIGVGVSDMERSVAFYRDVVGLNIVLDYYEGSGSESSAELYGDRERGRRHVVLFRIGEFQDNCFLVLSVQEGAVRGTPLEFDSVGIHHFAIWVRDLDPYLARLQAGGVKFLMPPFTAGPENMRGWALPTWLTGVRSCIFQDPDGTYVQLEEILPGEIPADFDGPVGNGWRAP